MTDTKKIDVDELLAIHLDLTFGEVEEEILFELPRSEYNNTDRQREMAMFEIYNLAGTHFETFCHSKDGNETLIYLSDEGELYCVKINVLGVTIMQIKAKAGDTDEIHS